MTDLDLTTRAIEPVAQFTLNHDDPYSRLALGRVIGTAMEAYAIRHHQARHHEEQPEITAHEEALLAAITVAGRSYAAAALNQAASVLGNKLDEDTFMALSDTAAALDLAVVEDLDGANGTGEDEGPEVRAFHGADGWTVPYEPGTQACTINHVPEDEGRQTCASTAVWKVVEQRGFGLTLSFWCDADLPNEHRHLAVRPDA